MLHFSEIFFLNIGLNQSNLMNLYPFELRSIIVFNYSKYSKTA